MAGVPFKLVPQNAELIRPEGAVAHGVTPDGKQLFRLVTKRTRSVPRLGPDGEQEYMLHPTTAMKLYPLRKHEPYDLEEIFFLESEGNNNVRKIPYSPPTPEQIAAEERAKRAAANMAALAEALGGDDVSITDLLAAAKARKAGNVVEPELPEPAYPVWKGASNWLLSDGTVVKGNREKATEAQAALEVPSF